jgi:hypothetical protein
MKKFKNHQRPRREYRFEIVDPKIALKIWWDSPFKRAVLVEQSSWSMDRGSPYANMLMWLK